MTALRFFRLIILVAVMYVIRLYGIMASGNTACVLLQCAHLTRNTRKLIVSPLGNVTFRL